MNAAASPTPAASPTVETAPIPPAVAPRFPIVLLLVTWLTVVIVAVLVTAVLPQSFVSTARIKIEQDRPDIPGLADYNTAPATYDPYFLQTQFEIIQSELILQRVVAALNLNTEWGKRYADGQKLKTSECLVMLRGRLDLRPVRNTPLIDIRVYGEIPAEAARQANAIATAYQQWRLDQSRSAAVSGLKSLQQKLEEVEARIQSATKHLAETETPAETVAPLDGRYVSYFEQKRKLEELLSFRLLLQRRITVGEVDLHLPRSNQVMIVESALPPLRPVRPNVPLNTILAIILGGIVGLVLALLVFGLGWRRYRKQSGGSGGWSGVRTACRIAIALIVGGAVGYNCAMPMNPIRLFVLQLLILLGGGAMAYLELRKPSPLDSTAAQGTEPSANGQN